MNFYFAAKMWTISHKVNFIDGHKLNESGNLSPDVEYHLDEQWKLKKKGNWKVFWAILRLSVLRELGI